ncbi:hypothetical protein GOP47_0012250 [Adiantum capillus-veneris]|uniref:MYB transcription factor n=1 Tax=Adiantum capillus-veneris TaxID=13818 RepID=A0A9D4ZEA0_ADICA|nr:hypothetical protein GOP47_0012250 [Adiantum capillus-veneris]
MGAPKQKWTSAEEAALRAGVKKHGLGKWRAIQKDPEFTFLLATRSNVDLKDKWRNMNIGVGGYISREKPSKSSKLKALKSSDEPISPRPLAILPGEYVSADDSYGAADALVSSDSPKESKSLGPRYTDMVIDAILDLNSPNGASSSDIAASIEANNLVPANFRRLLRLKLKDMVKDGSLLKVKENYKVNTGDDFDDGNQSSDIVAKKKMRGIVKSRGFDNLDDKRFRDDGVSDLTIRPPSKQCIKGSRGDRSMEKAMLDVDYARLKLKTAEEAARAAALAMAEAEAAAAAAEKAAKKARAAEAEAEAAEIAAEVAALAARPPKKARRTTLPVEEVAVAV